MAPLSVGTPALWAGFVAFVLVMLAVDLLLLGGRRAHRVSAREALAWSVVWVALAAAFCGLLWWHLDLTHGREVADAKALEFLTGYLIEKSLSVDNIFVFLMIFGYFAVPAEYQRRVLLLGVLGAIVMRAVMILAGVWLVARFHWVLYVFGVFLVVTGIKMLVFAEEKPDLERNPVLRWMRRRLPITASYHGERFTVREGGIRRFTPLFLVLVLIETSDLIFAVDSIPAIFAITTDPFIVFTSNIFAILGLRALYFLLADMAARFHLLKYGLALVLVLVGAKMLVGPFYPVPTLLTLGVVALIIATSILASLLAARDHDRRPL
jgi:TerC family integral membrane protein